jgi:hypothetical protein
MATSLKILFGRADFRKFQPFNQKGAGLEAIAGFAPGEIYS